MPELYDELNPIIVDEEEENNDLFLDFGDDIEVAETDPIDEADDTEIVVGEDDVYGGVDLNSLIPGSETAFVEEEEQEVKEKDWANDGQHGQFVSYVKDKLQKIPKHSGETVPGCERAKSYLKSIDNEISKAMRTDLNGEIDEHEVDAIRKEIENMIDRLEKQLKKLRGTKKANLDVRLVSEGHCDKCNSTAPMWHDVDNERLICMSCDSNRSEGMEKKASTPTINVYVSAFERAIVGTMINSKVSAGRNIEETYEKLKNKYNFTPREELAIQQLISDYGYPLVKDRGNINEPHDISSDDGVDWMTNYYA